LLLFADSTEALKYVKIGNVRASIRKPKSPHLVPVGFGVNEANSSVLSHLKWLLQKDSLKQDVFLIGVPGALRSHIVLQYLELCGREFEYLSITRDTTEADIKQRREIRNGTAFYTDLVSILQCDRHCFMDIFGHRDMILVFLTRDKCYFMTVNKRDKYKCIN
uniref:AAA_5 domain-containing protein n=1 Tax=Ascaris lumbricoides TaxID=6252 RepID=A0A0M3ITM1_ASCLU